MTHTQTYKLTIEGQPEPHTFGLTMPEVLKLADEAGHDAETIASKLLKAGKIVLADDVGSFTIEAE